MDSTIDRRRALGLGGVAVAAGAAATLANPSAAAASPGAGAPALNVKNPGFGLTAATGNGSTDDRVAIQAIIQYAFDHGGGTVFFPASRYKVGASLNVFSGVHLEGDGGIKNTSTWNGTSEIFGSGDFPVVQSSPVTGSGTFDIRLKDLSIRGNQGTSTSTWGGAASLRNVHLSVIDGCTIYGGGKAALELTGGQVIVRNCHIGGILEVLCGILSHDTDLTNPFRWLTDSLIVNNDQITTRRTLFTGFGGPGIKLGPSSGHNIIANNMIYFCDYGIVDTGTIGETITGNRIDMNMRSGIHITDVGEHVITGNSFHTNGGASKTMPFPPLPPANECAGVRISGSGGRNAITGNVFRNRENYNGAGGADPEDNKDQQYGVVLLGSTHHNAITGNTFVNQKTAAILDSSTQSATNVKSGNVT
jgi:parallel beta-helix repeat protein